jgi:hypothetical protein
LIDDLKEQIYEFENKNNELDFQIDNQKSLHSDQLAES